MSELTDVVEAMKTVAKDRVFRPGITEGGMTLVSEDTHRDIQYDGYTVGLTLSLDEIPEADNMKMWHLSVSIGGQNTPPTDVFLKPILGEFFPTGKVVELPPHFFPPQMRHIRQFISNDGL